MSYCFRVLDPAGSRGLNGGSQFAMSYINKHDNAQAMICEFKSIMAAYKMILKGSVQSMKLELRQFASGLLQLKICKY